ncbi:hypothetical protein C5F49_05685 [Nitrosopumilus oxyclinae]|uniref:Transmembrane protein n=2 Tax=Nitrosopumilus oxyclinae TaxID=1959104 RepID=A0A7D5R930_9ARCH|nr:hypothetical protein C5F49_05685 [Nitrosopumilus oxyclinae]
MFPTWKLIFQKTRLKNLTLILFAMLFVVLMIAFFGDSCSVDHLIILNEILSYEQSLDPEQCENILEQIYSYNDMCTSEIEILDCG